MSKGTIFVVVYSIILLILFVVFCVLMTSVNPDQIVTSYPPKSEKNSTEIDSKNLKRANYVYDLELDGSTDNKPRYGLMKLSPKDKAINLLVRKFNNDSYTDNKQHVHPTQPFNKTTQNNSTALSRSVKGQRRSVKEPSDIKMIKYDPGAVVVKIIDDTGHPRIEIKFNPKGPVKSKVSEPNITSSYDNDNSSVNSIHEYANDSIKEKENLIDGIKTVLEIMPNNTLYEIKRF